MTDPTVVIVEDDPDLSHLFARTVRKLNLETRIFTNGVDAFKALATQTPRLIILDLHLPDVSGEDILKTLRRSRRFDETWIVIASADAVLASQLRDKADFVLLKPILPSQLGHLVERLVDKPRALTKSNAFIPQR